MANLEHLDILKRGVEVWNEWRRKTSDAWFDLSQTDLSEVNLLGANLRRGTLRGANLNRAYLTGTDLSWTEFSETNLKESDLRFVHAVEAFFCEADLSDAVLIEANLGGANFYKANLTRANLLDADLNDTVFAEANLGNANLIRASLVRTNLRGANLVGCSIYGVSVWNVRLEEAIQENLIITDLGEPKITVDNLEVAQFIYLLLNNKKIRDVINTITSKVVLILGRFTEERKKVLDALREELRNNHDLTPVIFDFDPSKNQDLTETVSTLAHMSRFIIADLTDPSSVPHEMATIAPHCIRPIKPIILDQPMLINGQVTERYEYELFRDLRRRYDWVLPIYCYNDTSSLIASIKEQIITPAEQKAQELEKR